MAYKIPTQKSTYSIPKQSTSTAVTKASTQSVTKSSIPSVPAVAQPALSAIAPGINSVADIGKIGQQKVVSTSEGSVTLQRIDDNKYYYIKSDNNGGYISEVRSAPTIVPQVKVDSAVVSNQVATPVAKTQFKITPPATSYKIPTPSSSYKIPEQVTTGKSTTVPTVPVVASIKVADKQYSIPSVPATAQPALSSPAIKTAKIKSVLQEIYPKLDTVPDIPEPILHIKQIDSVPNVILDKSKVYTPSIPEVPEVRLIELIPHTTEPALISEDIYSGYIDVSPGESKILSSFQQSLAKYQDTWPDYVDGKQQCIQDAAYAMNNWRKDLASDDDPSNDNWYQYARLVTAKDDWHAMIVVSPNGLFANPKKDHIFDPRYNAYRGTISNYDNKEESELAIWSKFKTIAGSTEILADNGSRMSEVFVPNSESEAEDFKPGFNSDEVSQIKIDIAESGMIDDLTGTAILSGKPYYQSKLDPSKKYNEETYELKMNMDEKKNMQKMNPDGTVDTRLKVQSAEPEKQFIALNEGSRVIPKGTYLFKTGYVKVDESYKPDDIVKSLKEWADDPNKNPVFSKEYKPGEYTCVQFATDFVNASREAGFDTYVVAMSNDGDGFGHALVGLKVGEEIYAYDPEGNIEKNKYDFNKTILNPNNWTLITGDVNKTTYTFDTVTVPKLELIEPQSSGIGQKFLDLVSNLLGVDGLFSFLGDLDTGETASNSKYDNIGVYENTNQNAKSKVNEDSSNQLSTKPQYIYTTLNLDGSSMTTKQVAFTLAKQIYGENFSIPQMVDIYQFVQKYSTDGKFDVSKLGEINKEFGSTLKVSN